METAIRAIMTLYPLDDFDPDPVRVMMPVDDPSRVPDLGARCWPRSNAPAAVPSVPASFAGGLLSRGGGGFGVV